MDFYINLKVNFRGNAKNFLLSGSETKSWESMEAMVSKDNDAGVFIAAFTLAYLYGRLLLKLKLSTIDRRPLIC